MKDRNIILIGPMGAGKSAIGRELARRLDLAFFDADEVLQEKTGVDIALIFELEGEAGFRRREEMTLAELCKLNGAVIATGGGAVLSALNRERLRTGGTVVFLETSVEWQVARTRPGRQRPLLDTPDPRAKLAALHEIREPLYRECAHLVVSTDARHVNTVAGEIIERLRELDAPCTNSS